jgi:hypothetical protein
MATVIAIVFSVLLLAAIYIGVKRQAVQKKETKFKDGQVTRQNKK